MKTNWLLNRMLMSEHDDDGSANGGGDDYDDSAPEVGFEGDDDDSGDDDGAAPDLAAARSAKKDPPPVSFDQEAMALAIAKGLKMGQTPPPPAEMSDEEFQRVTKYKKVTPEQINKIISADAPPEDKIAAFQELLDGASEHAMMVAAFQQRAALDELRNEFSPLISAHREAQANKFIDTVVDKYPGLKNNRAIIKMAAQQVASSAKGPMTPEAAAKEVANVAALVIRQSIPEFSLKERRQSNGNMPEMAGRISTGGGGGGRSGGNANKKVWQQTLLPRK
jgi:hypothetical protein